MKILEKNPDNCGWSIESFCTGEGWQQTSTPCGAKLEVADKDLRVRRHTDISGFTDSYYGFVCPICHCFTEISSSKIPYNVRNFADKKQYSATNFD